MMKDLEHLETSLSGNNVEEPITDSRKKMAKEELGLAFCNLTYRETSFPVSPQKDSGFETSCEEYENVGDGHYENTQGECVKNLLYQNVGADNKAHCQSESPTVSYENVSKGADNWGEEQEPYENVCVRDDHEVCYENLDVETWEREYRPGAVSYTHLTLPTKA